MWMCSIFLGILISKIILKKPLFSFFQVLANSHSLKERVPKNQVKCSKNTCEGINFQSNCRSPVCNFTKGIFYQSLLKCVPCGLKTCSHANVPYVLTYLVCIRAHVPMYFACLRASMTCELTCLRAMRTYVLTCQRDLHVSVPMYLSAYLLKC